MAGLGQRLFCAVLFAGLAACSAPQSPPLGSQAALTDPEKSPPAPVATPSAPAKPAAPGIEEPRGPFETGRVTWYKRSRHTHTTASGEALDDALFTAAHRTLPLGSFVRVVDTATGNAVVVRINDRGPFTRDFIIDLTKSSADALGVFRNNKMIVQLEPLPAPPGADHPSVPVSTLPTGKAALAALMPPKPMKPTPKSSAGKPVAAAKPPLKPSPQKAPAAPAKSVAKKPETKKPAPTKPAPKAADQKKAA